MSRYSSSLGRLCFGALLFAITPLAAAQDDAKSAASAAQNQIGAIQKQLASGTELQRRLRLDKFEAGDGAVRVVGVFIDSPATKADDPVPFDQVTEELTKLVRDKVKLPNLKLDAKGITRIPPDEHPHVIVQLAANAAGAKGDASADRAVYTGSQFTASGGLSVVGFRTKKGDAFGWMAREPKTLLAKHPAYLRPNGTGSVGYNLKPVEWKVDPAELQKLLAASGKADGSPEEKNRLALRRLLVERAYFTYQVVKEEGKEATAGLRIRIEGLRLGEGEAKVEWAQDVIGPVVAAVAGKPVPGDYGSLVGVALQEPVRALRAAVAGNPALDGVRIDPGFTFGAGGELMLAGIQPGLTAEGQKELESTVRAALAAHGEGKPLAAKYGAIATRPVSVKRMTALPLGKVLSEMRAWAARAKDDLKLVRLYFPSDSAQLAKRYHVAEDGLVLLYRLADAADVKDVEGEFRRLLKAHVEDGIPPAPDGLPSDPVVSSEKEPLLPGLTAHLRKQMASDQKKWSGVLIERGFFDAQNRYTLLGVVDSPKQNEELAKLLAGLKSDPKWADFFSLQPTKPALDVVPMAEMLDRVKRVTPAYAVFDGIRIESARYNADANLVFDARVVGTPDRGAAPMLAKLLRDNPTYRRRAPAGKEVKIAKLPGGSPERQPGTFSVTQGAKLLERAGDSKGDREKAKAWLDTATLYHPNESGVWFLSAYYHFAIAKDDELARRDLYRVIEMEGRLVAGGTPQRNRRYEEVKDLQGKARTDLESLWLECYREVQKGAKSITMKKDEGKKGK